MENTMDDVEENSVTNEIDSRSYGESNSLNINKTTTTDEELCESESQNCDNVQSESSDTYLSKPEVVYIKEEITGDWDEESKDRFDYDHNSSDQFDDDTDKPITDEEVREPGFHNSDAESESNETCLQNPETVYIKEEVTDDFDGNSNTGYEFRSDTNDQPDKDDAIYQCRSNEKTKEKTRICKVCEKPFSDAGRLRNHMRIHAKKKTFTCEVCGKTFTQSTSVKVHMRSHTNERPYACKVCGKAFARSSRVTVHMRSHTKEKPYGCKVCGKMFTSSSHVTVHMRTHTKEKPYSCNVCGKLFSDLSSHIVHIRIHTKEKPYACNVCGKSFTQSTSAKKHMLIHNKRKSVLL